MPDWPVAIFISSLASQGICRAAATGLTRSAADSSISSGSNA
jgi:hypothetical protein